MSASYRDLTCIDSARHKYSILRVLIVENHPLVAAAAADLLRTFKELGVVRRCCVVTATRDDRLVAEARRIGVLGYIQKRSAFMD